MPVMQETTYWILTSLTGGRRHGYALLKEISDLTEGRVGLKVTTLYAALDRLQQRGLIANDGEETVDGRQRRYVVLTADGAAALTFEVRRLADAGRRAAARLQSYGLASASPAEL